MVEIRNYYFDNAATSWPKPERVYRAVDTALRLGGSPGRSGHQRTLAAERQLYEARVRVAAFFGARNPSSLIFTLNATDALNMAIKGLVKRGDHVITTPFEHNSVARPLNAMVRDGLISLEEIPCTPEGSLDVAAYRRLFKENTALVVSTHASNVTGQLLPVEELGAIARARKVPFLLDAAQTAGVYPLDMGDLPVDMMAFAGHKGTLGPQGTGGLLIQEGILLRPWREGGTGSRSHEVLQPSVMPDYLEAGTMNMPGIAGLEAGIDYIESVGLETIRNHEIKLATLLREGLQGIPGARVYGPANPAEAVAVVSFTLEGVDCGDIGFILEEVHGILSRTGLHCAPGAHRCLGTFPQGTVRLSPGYSTSEEDTAHVLKAVAEIAAEAGLV